MRFIVASFLVLSSFNALNAEPLTPVPTQKYRLAACNSSQASAVKVCRDNCDETMLQCASPCRGQSPSSCKQCVTTHTTCLQGCLKSSGC
jgi:hypothetical protein